MEQLNLSNRTVLNDIAEKVEQDENIDHILKAMFSVLDKRGIGLAAPQIGASKRIIMIKTPGRNAIILNPVITRRRLGTIQNKEGCLSFPGLLKKVKRDKQIIVEGFNLAWEPIKLKLRGLDAYCVQHEIDHLNGITLKNKK